MRIYALFPKILNEIFLNRLMHNYKLIVYNFCMKKLLTLLLLSPVLAADIVNLKCERYKVFDSVKNTESSMSVIFSVSIDTDSKTGTTEGLPFEYTEDGDIIRWFIGDAPKVGDVKMTLSSYNLDRVTGELKDKLLYFDFPNGIKSNDDMPEFEELNYFLISAKCKKTESLF